jgi:hypothetical protein
MRYKGARLSTVPPTTSYLEAVGLWTLRQQLKALAQQAWPTSNGQQAYTTPGTYTWVAPFNVYSVSVVCIGAGGGGWANPTVATGGGGGGLAYLNNISVVPGNSYTVVVGGYVIYATGQSSSFNGATIVATGGKSGDIDTGDGGTYSGVGVLGGTGGKGNVGGGGTAGYSGAGGAGTTSLGGAGSNGAGGGGGGGGATASNAVGSGGGGGVGIFGQGANGAGGIAGSTRDSCGGGGGSGGTNSGSVPLEPTRGGLYGGGSGSYSGAFVGGNDGAVRIIWGPNRAFPSTNTGDL